ncbi:hypothetical protein [Sphingobacterium puteale]|uniref:hypothetical protein n=1 Tax=Sphingobacterium puteale TaxID=2420510 RepID=UPI003D953871
MNKLFFFIACFFILNICHAQNIEVIKLANQFIDTLEAHSFMRSKIDFDRLRTETNRKVKNLNKTDSLLSTFKEIVSGLKDHHSSVARVKDTTDNLAFIKMIASTTYEKEGMSPLNFQHRLIEDKYAYINVPGVLLEHRRYIDTLQKQLFELDGRHPKAWIIDLTENDGALLYQWLLSFIA